MSKEPERKLIVIREGWLESAKKDALSVLCAFAMIGPGVLLNSSAMQWAGFFVLLLIAVSRASGLREKHAMTLEEAEAYLADLRTEITNRKNTLEGRG